MKRPLKGIPRITQVFAANDVNYAQFGLKGHHGVDYWVGTGTPVYAPESGTITTSSNGTTDQYTGRVAAGEVIILKGQYEHWFMHLSKRLVGTGVRVSEGELIGYTGNTGLTTGPHLHWGVRPLQPNINNGYRGFIDPATVLHSPPPQPPPTNNNQGVKVMDRRAGQQMYLTAFHRSAESDGAADQWNGQHPSSSLEFVRNSTEWQITDQKIKNYDNLVAQINELNARPTKAQLDQLVHDIDAERTKVLLLEEQLEEEKSKPPVIIEKPVEKVVEKEVIREVEPSWLKRVRDTINQFLRGGK